MKKENWFGYFLIFLVWKKRRIIGVEKKDDPLKWKEILFIIEELMYSLYIKE